MIDNITQSHYYVKLFLAFQFRSNSLSTSFNMEYAASNLLMGNPFFTFLLAFLISYPSHISDKIMVTLSYISSTAQGIVHNATIKAHNLIQVSVRGLSDIYVYAHRPTYLIRLVILPSFLEIFTVCFGFSNFVSRYQIFYFTFS